MLNNSNYWAKNKDALHYNIVEYLFDGKFNLINKIIDG